MNAKMKMLSVAEPMLGPEERMALSAVIDDGWVTMGPRVETFERAFASRHGAADAVAVSSCTAGLHLLLAALGVGPGDEVLVPSLTFVATASSVVYVGGRPVFVDIKSIDDPQMSMADAQRKITARTRAVIVMHYAGRLAPMDDWARFATNENILLIENSAHAVGIDGVGRYSDGAAFSFYGNKNMTTAEGGMVVARSQSVLRRIRSLRGHGMTTATFEKHRRGSAHYDVTALGWNYRMDELRAALGLVQLKHVTAWNRRRQELARLYRELLAQKCPKIVVPGSSDEESACHIMPVVLPEVLDRELVAAEMRDLGVQTSVHYPPVHLLSWYRERYTGIHLPLTEQFAGRELTLPLHPGMQDSDVERASDALRHASERATQKREGQRNERRIS